ncbi:MAG: hypothetical protein FJ098_01930 [Deltaproteobacteria bacterium]|nr:hypothetical protein [Deltaproteobacteria bacterium]
MSRGTRHRFALRDHVRRGLALLVLLACAPAAADPMDWFGYDARAMATGGGAGGVALARSASALHANPGALVRATPGIGWDYVMYHPLLAIRPFPRTAGLDVPASVYDRAGNAGTLATADLPVPRGDTVLEKAHHAIIMGVVSDFGLEGFRLSTILKTPLPTLASVRFRHFDEREQALSNRLHLARFGEWDDMIFLHTGAAYRPLPWLSFGLSLKTNFLLRSRTTTVTAGAAVASITNGAADFAVRFRPAFGLLFRPVGGLHLGLAYRLESRVQGEFTTRTVIPGEGGGVEVLSRRDPRTSLFEPHELALGVGWEGEAWGVEASGTWARWSEFRSSLRTDPGEEGARYRFGDGGSVALGGRWSYRPWAEALAGLAFFPSPVPAQTGRTSYVDGEVLGLTAGHRFRFPLLGIPVETGLFLQAWHLVEETVRKDPARILDEDPSDAALQTNNPGYPGYRAGGWVLVTGASLRLEL